MTMEIDTTRKDRGRSTIRWNVVLFFTAVGPLIGGLFIGSVSGLADFHSVADFGAMPTEVWLWMVLGVYAAGLWPAAAAGLLFAAVEARFGSVGWRMATAIGLLVGAGFAAALILFSQGRDPSINLHPANLALMVSICLVPTIICSFMARWFRR